MGVGSTFVVTHFFTYMLQSETCFRESASLSGDGGFVEVQAAVNVLAMESEGTVVINGPVFPDNLIPEGHYQARIHSFNPIWIRATGSHSRMTGVTELP